MNVSLLALGSALIMCRFPQAQICAEHDVIYVTDVKAHEFTDQELVRLNEIGFVINEEYGFRVYV